MLKLRTLAASLGLVSAGTVVGLLLTKPLTEQAFRLGVKQGLAQQDLKKLAVKNSKFTRELCNAWWFNYDHRDRRIK